MWLKAVYNKCTYVKLYKNKIMIIKINQLADLFFGKFSK